jgi:hypothetical protein
VSHHRGAVQTLTPIFRGIADNFLPNTQHGIGDNFTSI